MHTTTPGEAVGRRPPGTGIVGENASEGKGIMRSIGYLEVQDLALAGLILTAFGVSVASCVMRRNHPTTDGTRWRPTETLTGPSIPPGRGRRARGCSGRRGARSPT